MLKLELQYFGHLMQRAGTHLKRQKTNKKKRPLSWLRLKAEGEGAREDEMVGWHHRLSGDEFQETPGVDDGQGSLVCPWGGKELDMTERLNWTELKK